MTYIQQLLSLSEDEQASAVAEKIEGNPEAILESSEFERLARRTSATDWGIEEFEIDEIIEITTDQCVARVNFAARGEPPEDAFFDGDEVRGQATVVIDENGRLSVEHLNAEVGDSCAF